MSRKNKFTNIESKSVVARDWGGRRKNRQSIEDFKGGEETL